MNTLESIKDGGFDRLNGGSAPSIPFPLYGTPDGKFYNADGVRIQAIAYNDQWHAMDDIISKYLYMPMSSSTFTRFKHDLNEEARRFLPISTPEGRIVEVDVVGNGSQVAIIPVYEKPKAAPIAAVSRPKIRGTPPDNNWESKMSKEERDFCWRKIRKYITANDLSCADNFRAARMWKSSDRRRFKRLRDSGCCGSANFVALRWSWTKMRFDVYLLGLNYGH